mgnify:CR=1 FL=1
MPIITPGLGCIVPYLVGKVCNEIDRLPVLINESIIDKYAMSCFQTFPPLAAKKQGGRLINI